MKLGRVIGNAVSTIKNPAYNNAKLMVVQPLDLNLQPAGRTHLAVDLVGAGPGEVVLVAEEGRGARELLNNPKSPIRTTLIGIVDRVDLTPATDEQEPKPPPPLRRSGRLWGR
jgi:ethanolamine utilization protein EutN